MYYPNHAEIAELRKRYPAGTRIRLIFTDDPYTHLSPGDKATVTSVDDAGTVHLRWDNGSSLGLLPGVDVF